MKITIKHIHHTPSDSFTALIEQHLDALGKTRQIDEARIVIERRMEASPPFRVSAHLVTPGPDVLAEAVEHTLRAAFEKTIAQLAAVIDRRHLKRAQRLSNSPRAGKPGRSAAAGARS